MACGLNYQFANDLLDHEKRADGECGMLIENICVNMFDLFCDRYLFDYYRSEMNGGLLQKQLYT